MSLSPQRATLPWQNRPATARTYDLASVHVASALSHAVTILSPCGCVQENAKKKKKSFSFFFPLLCCGSVSIFEQVNQHTHVPCTTTAHPPLRHDGYAKDIGSNEHPLVSFLRHPTHTHCDVAACSAGWVRDYAQYRHNAPKAEDWRWMRTFVEASTQYAVNCPKRGGHGRGSLRHSTSPDLSADTKRVGVRDPDTMARWPASSGPKRLGCAKR